MQDGWGDGSSGSVWLMQCWLRMQERWKGDDRIDLLMWNVAGALPAFLLCRRSCRSQHIDDVDVQILHRQIEQRWKDSVTEGAWLPRHVTCHLLRSLNDPAPPHQLNPCLRFAAAVRSFQLFVFKSVARGPRVARQLISVARL